MPREGQKVITFWVTPEEYEVLELAAQNKLTSKTDLLRRYIRKLAATLKAR